MENLDPRQRVMDAEASYRFLESKTYIKNDAIGLIGWSWWASSALFVLKVSRRFGLPSGGFKGAIAFYPNSNYLTNNPQWGRTGSIIQPALILYSRDDTLESENSYNELLAEGHPGPLRVIGYNGVVRKFVELGKLRTKSHPKIGEFKKVFHLSSFEDAVKKKHQFLEKFFR